MSKRDRELNLVIYGLEAVPDDLERLSSSESLQWGDMELVEFDYKFLKIVSKFMKYNESGVFTQVGFIHFDIINK